MFEILYGGASGAMQSFARRGMTQDQMLKIIAYVQEPEEAMTSTPQRKRRLRLRARRGCRDGGEPRSLARAAAGR